MSIIVQRTNPDRLPSGRFKCCACRRTHNLANDARACATEDHATRRHLRGPAPIYDVDINRPPCEMAS